MANRKLSRLELIKVNELLKLHLFQDGLGWRYKDDWSDAKVAFQIAQDIQSSTVGNVRLELFGKLSTSGNNTRDENIKIKELETVVQNLVTCYGELEVKYNTLIDTIAINRIIPTSIKHLKTTHKEENKHA